ncbi:MAG: polysaccharide biosynthesis protein [Lachnospiraceae bacterium]|nr:polysaccharide biosynthesis protein [Lachnospiraceae bacterium]MDY4097823.1 polysaccharide biosynthesis protein [Lachnospiraceae bacterium]
MGRIQYAVKNIAFGYIGNITSTILGFVLRTVFIMKLDETLLGVNGLYTGILTMLSLAELGIGTALNYSLYAPVAKGDIEKIKSYMLFYKKAYLAIAGVVTAIGIILIPFLKYFIKNPGDYGIRELTVYYLIFLFNTVSTYFVAYKYSLVNAQQKNYIQTNALTLTKLATTVSQIIVLLATANFLFYLLTAAVVELIQKIYVNHYLNRLYPYLKEKNVKPLKKEETQVIKDKTRALVYHKVGDVARLQTDSIIISSLIQVSLVGVVDNYTMVINSISGFVNIIFNSVISSFGNLIATESEEKQYEMFNIYRFAANWVYGLSAIGFYVLLTPLVYLWLGEDWLLGNIVVALILVDYYFKGDRIVLSNFKTAAGVFEEDKYLALIQGVVNLVISIVLVQFMGLAGIYVGTIVSGLIANVTKPFIIYRVCFKKGAGEYFLDTARKLLVLAVTLAIVLFVSKFLLQQITMLSFALTGVMIILVYNVLFLLCFGRTKELRYLLDLVKKRGLASKGA